MGSCNQRGKEYIIQQLNSQELRVKMRIFIITCLVSSVFSAPQFLNENKVGENCHTEVSTVFEEVGSESVKKVVCETEFRDNCVTLVQNICRNATTGVQQCEEVDRFHCTDTITTKCAQEKVLRNVSYTENICTEVLEDICEKEIVDGVVRDVEGSCVTKTVEQCLPVTRFQEEFVDEEVCRDIPIKDCESVKENECNDQQQEICEDLETEKCEVVPHEECKQIFEEVPIKQSRKVFTTVCDDDDDKANMEIDEDYDVPDLKDILAIFGVSNSENEIPNDDDDSQLTSTTATIPTTTTTSTTATFRTSTTTTTFRVPTTVITTTESELTTTQNVRQMDSSKIVFSDASINARNKELSQKDYVRRILNTTTRPSDRNKNN